MANRRGQRAKPGGKPSTEASKTAGTLKNLTQWRWWIATLWPVLVVCGFLVLANYPVATDVGVSVAGFRSFSLSYFGSSHGTRSPACGCLDYDPNVWRGVTFAYTKVELGPIATPSGNDTGYVIASPIPSGISYVLPFGLEVDSELHEIPAGAESREVQAERLMERSTASLANSTKLFTSLDGALTVSSRSPLQIYSKSSTPIGAWLPLEGSTLEVTKPQTNMSTLDWSFKESFGYDPKKSQKVDFEQIIDHPEFQVPDVQHPIVDLIGRAFAIFIAPGAMVYRSGAAEPFYVPEDRSKDYVLILRVPFSVRIGVIDWASSKPAEATADGVLQRYYQAATPRKGSLTARISANAEVEKDASKVIREEPLIWVSAREIGDTGGVYRQVPMLRPPVPALPGANIFGPIRTIVYQRAKGDVVIGAEPMPTFAAPTTFEVAPAAARAFDGPIPVRVDGERATFSSEFASKAKLTINGQAATTIESRLTGPARDIFNIGALLAAISWIILRGRSALEPARSSD